MNIETSKETTHMTKAAPTDVLKLDTKTAIFASDVVDED